MTNEEIEKQLRLLHDRITDGFLRSEALRVTLEQRAGPEGRQFHQSFEENLSILQQRLDELMAKRLIQKLEDDNRELTRLLLELHEGTKQ